MAGAIRVRSVVRLYPGPPRRRSQEPEEGAVVAEAEWQRRHREIEELHRTILAQMDESDRRAAEREKERAEKRAALDAQVGLRTAKQGASSGPVKIDLKRWTETWDRFFRLLEERLPKKRADEANG